jgi:hypothetical protein
VQPVPTPPWHRTLGDRWAEFDAAYAVRTSEYGEARLVEAIEALVDCHWRDGVVDALEGRAAVLSDLGAAIAMCWWDDEVPDELQQRMRRLAHEA